MYDFKSFLEDRDRGLYNDLVGFDYLDKNREPQEHPKSEPESEELKKEPEKKGISRRGFLGGAAAALGLAGLGAISANKRPSKKIMPTAPPFKDEEDEKLPDHYDDEHHDDYQKDDKDNIASRVTYKNQTPDPEAYLKSLGPVRRMGAKNDPNSYYHQIGGKKQGILGKIFGNRRR